MCLPDGPKRYDVPWRELEGQGYCCCGMRKLGAPRCGTPNGIRRCDKRHQFRIAAENPRKYDVVQSLQQESGRRVLIIGEYLAQLQQIAELTGLSTVTGKTSQTERERLYEQFRSGARSRLILAGWQLCPRFARCRRVDSSFWQIWLSSKLSAWGECCAPLIVVAPISTPWFPCVPVKKNSLAIDNFSGRTGLQLSD